MNNNSRREFLKITAAGVAALALNRSGGTLRAEEQPPRPPAPDGRRVVGLACAPLDVVRWGLIGIGARGSGHLKETLHV
jgi:hypothetical protein